MIYLPVEITDNNCAYIRNEEIVRVYEQKPTTTGNYSYRDYYIHFDYNYTSGVSQFSQYSTYPDCLSSNIFTTNYFSRIDLADIMLVVFIMLIICFLFPLKLLSRFLGRWLKL